MGIRQRRTSAVVIGAGIGGLCAAAALRRADVDVRVYERAPALRAEGSGLSVMSNAVMALASAGIDLGLELRGQAIEAFDIRDRHGRLLRRQPVKEIGERLGAPSFCISRHDLHEALLAEIGDVPVHLGSAATRYEYDAEGVTVHFADGSYARGDVLVGADGLRSVIRRQLAGPEPERDSGYVCWLALTSFTHPRLPCGYVGHYMGAGMLFGLVDIGRGRYYWWGTRNMPASRSLQWSGGKDEIIRAYSGWADEVQQAIRATPEDAVIAVPSGDRRFRDGWGEGPVTLLGDAAHPMLTSLGQGAGMAIEDAVVLADAFTKNPDWPVGALREYERRRRDRTRMMVTASRAFSDVLKAQGRVSHHLRDAAFRSMPAKLLSRQLEKTLTFSESITLRTEAFGSPPA